MKNRRYGRKNSRCINYFEILKFEAYSLFWDFFEWKFHDIRTHSARTRHMYTPHTRVKWNTLPSSHASAQKNATILLVQGILLSVIWKKSKNAAPRRISKVPYAPCEFFVCDL